MLLEILSRGMRRWRPAIGWFASSLIALAIWTAAAGVMDADWAPGDILFLYVSTMSLLASAILVSTRISGRWATLLLGLLGLLYVGQVVAHVLPPLLDAVRELWVGATWLWLRMARPDALRPTWSAWNESGIRLATFGERLASWAVALVTGQSMQNTAAFLFVSGLIMWACVAWVVWWIVRRERPLLAMLPLGTVLCMSTYLNSGEVGWVVGFVSCVTLLLPIARLSLEERRWDRDGVDYSPEIRFDVLQIAFMVVLAVVLFSLLTPNFSIPRLVWSFWELISRPQAVIRDLVIRFFGGVEPEAPPELPVPSSATGARPPADASLPRAHLLGGQPDLSFQRVMYVCIDAPAPMPEDIFPPEGAADVPQEAYVDPKYYWRGITYDTFTGRSWRNKLSSSREIPAYEPVLASTITNTISLRQRYLIEVPHGETLYAVGEPSTVDQVIRSRLRAADDLVGLEGTLSDYVVHSKVSQTTVGQLQESQAGYSDYIIDRYLELYNRTPARVRALATEITQGIDSTYDRTVAIERYLRQFPYDLEVSIPQSGQDVVEFFLFDLQRGYCDYYASSFVVLARAAGIPARLAVGYAMGRYDTVRGCYEVVEKDGHSWPEIYFPEYGWIPFEPTAPFRLFERPQDEISPSERVPSIPSVPRRPWSLIVRAWWFDVRGHWQVYVAIVGIALLFVLFVIQLVRQWWHSRLTPVEAIALYYRDMSRLGERLGVPRHPCHTPAEYGTILSAAIGTRIARWPWRGRKLALVIKETSGQVRVMSSAYEHASYGAHSLTKAHQIQAERQWQQLGRRLQWLWLASAPAITGDSS